MRGFAIDVERYRSGRPLIRQARARQDGGLGSAHAPPRRLLLALPLALALGGCTMVQADPVDRAALGPLSPMKASAPHAAATEAPGDAAWRLRLTRL